MLEYIHSKEYVHADIKASNLLVGHKPGTENQVFLVDFGLARYYANEGRHKEYKYDQRKAHDGTIEFTSRDAHIGGELRFVLGQFVAGMRNLWLDASFDMCYVAVIQHFMYLYVLLLKK